MGKKSSIPTDVLNSIQKDYKSNLKPKDIGEKYGLTAKRVSEMANYYGWTQEKKENNARISKKIQKKLELSYAEQIAKIKADGRIIALNTLVEVMTDEEAKKSDRVSAANGFLKVTGDCLQTNKIEGEVNSNITNSIPPENWKELNKHIVDFIKN